MRAIFVMVLSASTMALAVSGCDEEECHTEEGCETTHAATGPSTTTGGEGGGGAGGGAGGDTATDTATN